MTRLIAAVLMLTFAGCATPYQRVAFAGGFSETQLAENVFKVSFRGNGYTGREQASDFALLRAAEVTIENGFRYFAVVDEQSYASHSTYTTPTTTYGSATAYGNTAYGSATTYGGQTYLISKPSSNNMIVCFKDKPEGFVFEAAFVARSLRQKYGLPGPEQSNK